MIALQTALRKQVRKIFPIINFDQLMCGCSFLLVTILIIHAGCRIKIKDGSLLSLIFDLYKYDTYLSKVTDDIVLTEVSNVTGFQFNNINLLKKVYGYLVYVGNFTIGINQLKTFTILNLIGLLPVFTFDRIKFEFRIGSSSNEKVMMVSINSQSPHIKLHHIYNIQ